MFPENDTGCATYLFHNQETGQAYVGSTGEELKRRRQHLYMLQNGKHPNRRLQRAYDQNPNFDYMSVPMEDREAAYDLEQAILDAHWGEPGLLNLSSNARYGQYNASEETRAKISQALRERVVSEETRVKMAEARRGYVFSPETIEKFRNQVTTEQKREKLREKMQGNKNGLGAKHPAESVARRAAMFSNPVEVDGVTYPSHAAAAEHFGVSVSTVTNRINSPNPLYAGWKKK